MERLFCCFYRAVFLPYCDTGFSGVNTFPFTGGGGGTFGTPCGRPGVVFTGGGGGGISFTSVSFRGFEGGGGGGICFTFLLLVTTMGMASSPFTTFGGGGTCFLCTGFGGGGGGGMDDLSWA
jgi:hypothetical protein